MSESTRDRPEGVDAAPRVQTPAPPGHLVITVHGIRTFGNWQADLERLLEEAEPGITILNYQYGYFSTIAFLLPPLRWLVARRFRKFFVSAMQAARPGAKIDLVAHSFGTYLAASALPYIPEERRLATVVFAGSVLRPSFPWYKYEREDSVGRVVNECGWDDSILLLCQLMGMAGRVGFQGMVGRQFTNRYYRFGHAGYFDREHRFMRQNWVPLLTSDAPVEAIDERPPITTWGGFKLFLMNNLQFIKVAGAVVLALAIILMPIDWMRKAEYQKRVERFNHIARLTNAVQIPGRDPTHVRDLLRVDARYQGHEDKAIDQMIGKEVAPEGDEENAADDADGDPTWWERITGLSDSTREAFRARQLHASANFQLAAGKQGRARDRSKAKLLYEDAIRSYKRVNNGDPAHGSYALCLMDYGLLLTQMGLNKEAREPFRMVREEVFPLDDNGERSTMPLSLLVDSYTNEAGALQNLKQWDDAWALLVKAVTAAGTDDALKSSVFQTFAWLSMERLNVAKARDQFLKSKDACEKLADGDFIFKARLFNVRHGLAMTQRLCGQSDESYNQYDQIVKELQELMKKDFNYYPKQRRDLSDRLVNSMERRADVWFFSRRPLAADRTVMKPASDPGSPGNGRDDDLALLEKVEKDYDEAITQVENDDPDTKIRLLYKKVIAHVIGEVRRRHPGVVRSDSSAEGSPLEAIRFVFSEAERSYSNLSQEMKKDLKIYHEIAASCMKMCESMRGDPTQNMEHAVAALRGRTSEYAKTCDDLKRDHVEMLLVALQLLLEPRIADAEPPKVTAQDASRMLAVLGIAMKASTHEELWPYVDPLNRMASARLLKEEGPAESRPRVATTGVSTSLPAPGIPQGRLLFFLRLSPKWALTLTESADGHDMIPGGPLPVKIEEADDPSTGPKGASKLATAKP